MELLNQELVATPHTALAVFCCLNDCRHCPILCAGWYAAALDQIILLKSDNIVGADFADRNLTALGITSPDCESWIIWRAFARMAKTEQVNHASKIAAPSPMR